jgi:hypothetical protein
MGASEQKKFSALRIIKEKHRWIVDKFDRLPNSLKTQLPDGLDVTLESVYDLIRRQRNDLGHPKQPPFMDRSHAFTSFQLFLAYVRDAEALAAFCKSNPL